MFSLPFEPKLSQLKRNQYGEKIRHKMHFLAKDTTVILQQLRLLMMMVDIVQNPLTAYIVPSGDAHHVRYYKISFVPKIHFLTCIQRVSFLIEESSHG